MSSAAPLRARTAHFGHVLRTEGVGGISSRLGRKLGSRLAAAGEDLAIRPTDLLRPRTPERLRPLTGTPHITVVTTPPSQRSGGHATIMRIVAGLTERGFTCTLAVYDSYGVDAFRHEPTIRALYPAVRAAVVDADRGLPESDIILATSWQTAQVVERSACIGRRMYLVQDFEPWFYAQGSAYALAEQTYRFGMQGIAIGGWLADRLLADYGMDATAFPYACDTATYDVAEPQDRCGVVFYARPSTPRRGFLLGMLALGLVKARRPEVPVHIFGETTGWTGFDIVEHGTMPPARIARLYASAQVGLALSMTDVSLAPMEMLAAGLPAVVNDSPWVRADLGAMPVRYAEPSPEALANGIVAELESPRDTQGRERLRAAAREMTWDRSIDIVADAVSQQLRRDS